MQLPRKQKIKLVTRKSFGKDEKGKKNIEENYSQYVLTKNYLHKKLSKVL
jgi:hypothetical protein